MTAPTGTGLTYSIDGTYYQSSVTFSNVSPGTYSLTVKNAAGCSSSVKTVTINAQPTTTATPTITSNAAGAVCQGTSVTLSSNISSGNQWYKDGVAIAGATSTTYITSLSGSYTVVATETGKCSSAASSPSVINVIPIPDASIAQGSQLAFTNCSQTTLTLSASTGASSPTYEWYKNGVTTSVTSQTYSVTQSGSYEVKITSNGCSSTSPVTIVTDAPSATATGTTSVCQGQFVSLSTTSTGSYKWQLESSGTWNDISGATNSTYNATSSGNYRVEIGGSTSCPISVTVNQLPSVTVSASPSINVCAGTPVTLSASASGTSTPTYQWKIDDTNIASETASTYTATLSGNYKVLLTDGNGCQSTSSSTQVTVSAIDPAPSVGTITQPTCSVSTGSVELSGLPSSGTWTVTASDGSNSTTITGTGTTATFSGLTANKVYTFTVTNNNGCTSASSSSATINAQPSIPTLGTTTLTQPTCTISTGAISISGSTGTGLTFSIDGSTYQSSSTFYGVSPGTYSVTVMNDGGCVSTATSVTINAQPATPAAATTTLTQPSCAVSTGTISITAPTGTGYTYSIDGSTYTSTTTFSGLTPNVYNITVKSGAGCVGTSTSVTITAQPSTPPTPSVNLTQPTCVVSTGTINITAPTGTGLTYSINGTTYQSSGYIS